MYCAVCDKWQRLLHQQLGVKWWQLVAPPIPVHTGGEKKYTRSRKKDSLTELYALAIMDLVAKENHTIDWVGVKFHARDTTWTAWGWIRQSRSERQEPTPWTGMVGDTNYPHCKEYIAICYKWHSMSTLMYVIVGSHEYEPLLLCRYF